MAAEDFPTSYRDPVYASLDQATEQKLGLPVGMLQAVRTDGEKTDADKVSSAGARTPYQIIPSTRKAILAQYGIDAYLSPENASEAAGLLLRDSLKRNDGDPEAAVREYHGGTDRAAWGKINDAYWRRVSEGMRDISTRALSTAFGQWMADNPAVPAAAAPVNAAQQPAPGSDDLAKGFAWWLAGKDKIPGTPTPEREPVPLGLPPKAAPEDPGLIDKAIGAGEAALNLGTGLTGGAAGMVGGAVKGAAREIAAGNFGSPEAAQRIAQSAASGAQALTYQPRTESGQQQAAAVGDVAQNLIPVAPLGAEMGALAKATGAAREVTAPLLGNAVERVMQRAQTGAPPTEASAIAAQPAAGTPAAALVAPAAAEAPAASLEQVAAAAKRAADGSQAATADLAAAAAPDAKTVQAATRLGIQDHLQPDHVTTSQAYRELAQAVKSIPGSEARAAELDGLRAVGERASKIVDDLGGADVSGINDAVRAQGLKRVADLTKQADALYSQVREALPVRSEAPAEQTLAFVRKRAEDLGGEQNLSPMEKSILSRLSPKPEKTVETVPGNPLMPGQMTSRTVRSVSMREPTYALLDDVRRDVGAVAGRGGPFADADVGLAKKYYGLLSDDQMQAAERAGMGPTYKAAQASVALRKGVENDLASLFGKELDRSLAPSLQSAMQALPKGDSAKLARILDAVPADMRQDVVAAGLQTAFRSAATNGPISFSQYAKWFEGLVQNKASYRAMMTALPQSARKQLSDLYRVSKAVAAASRERITTGRIQAATELFRAPDSLASRLYAAASRSAVGATVGTAVGHLAGPGVGGAVASALTKGAKPEAIRSVDRLIASPEFERLARAGTQAQERAAVRQMAKSAAFARFMRQIGAASSTVSQREAWLYEAMTPASQGMATQSRRDQAQTLH